MKNISTEELYKIFLEHPVVSTDTRNIPAGSLFFALKGANFNANEFASEAIKKGCSYAIIEEEKYYTDKCILVPDVLKALQNLANHHRRQFTIPVIGITGTNGKTTTKELTAAVLSKKYNTLFTQGNLNNHIGVPITLLKLTSENEMAVIEMGANHVGEIDMLCRIAEPDYGIITNIGKAHLEGFGSYEGVIKAKSELYKFIKEKNGELFINADDELLIKLANGVYFTYGMSRDADIRGFQDKDSFLAKGTIEMIDGEDIQVSSSLAGAYNFYNILAAACIGFYFEVTPEQIKQAIEEYVPSNNRSQIVKKGGNTIWVDAYNANPSSMKTAIENFAALITPHKVLILGDMFELGEDSQKEHQAIADLIGNSNWEAACLIGDEFSKVKSSANLYTTVEEFAKWLSKHPLKDATILLKGSRGMQMERVMEKL
ncbi:MAG TPA: UDP-N-acetylmuramoyl-tripeptide--D-alanyl-D-alanine ligase [Bacteroidia bacterium]|jgi:UDP-N-acetylmuramoyl-tripeptide--D-alanyl-D-alanine ligase|nr:UDP-N-acetylmuramoyl-tripeptide--D-alanyl-D-alanine ligase [Bacteroidia bacterium]